MTPSQPCRLDREHQALRRKHDALRTEEADVGWIIGSIRFHHTRHPRDMGAAKVEAFLTHLTVQVQVAAATQNQALSALLFPYREVFHQECERPVDAVRAKAPQRLPSVLSKAEI
ncbi:MAG: phage integrase N-terminal SAM-like domain-containing protein, partial [Chloroflexales bacterium]|nr:phage integrase N-terminal SAM-like domain-containing protein [Chloroflexales bacterium]